MHDAHLKAAEQHELAAHAHRTAAEHNEKVTTTGENGTPKEHLSTPITPINSQRKRTRNPHGS